MIPPLSIVVVLSYRFSRSVSALLCYRQCCLFIRFTPLYSSRTAFDFVPPGAAHPAPPSAQSSEGFVSDTSAGPGPPVNWPIGGCLRCHRRDWSLPTVPSWGHELPRRTFLAEFTPVSVEYDGVFEPYITPPGQSSHFAAQGFDLLGGATFEALPSDSLIAKQFRFVDHHVLLHAEIGVNFDIEVHHSPLAEGTLYHAAVLRELMAPEQALLLLSLGGKLLLKALSGVPSPPAAQHPHRTLHIQCLVGVLIVPPFLPGSRLWEQCAVFRPFFLRERVSRQSLNRTTESSP